MNIEKIRNLGPDELLHQQRDAADQLFRLKFQLKMGQTTGIKKMRELRKDLARIKTIARERELGITNTVVGNAMSSAAPEPKRETAAVATQTAGIEKSARAVVKKKSVTKKTASAASGKTAAKKKKTRAKK